jgi:hypothetical protein
MPVGTARTDICRPCPYRLQYTNYTVTSIPTFPVGAYVLIGECKRPNA